MEENDSEDCGLMGVLIAIARGRGSDAVGDVQMAAGGNTRPRIVTSGRVDAAPAPSGRGTLPRYSRRVLPVLSLAG
jgi:hypothetical protein